MNDFNINSIEDLVGGESYEDSFELTETCLQKCL